MNIPQQQSETGSATKLELIEALRYLNAWEAANASAEPFRIKFFRNYSAEFIEPFLKYHFARRGLRCEITFGGFDSFQQDILQATDFVGEHAIVVSLTADALIAGRRERESPADAAATRLGAGVPPADEPAASTARTIAPTPATRVRSDQRRRMTY